jgi:Tol biopolymer transport system component
MSPEQAEAKKVDARSDIFSFGSVLYEMVTGRRAFQGRSKLSTLSAILKDDPEPVSRLVPDVPRDMEKIISHCLRKDPERRFQHMDDLKVALLDLKEESESGKLQAVTGAGSARRRRLGWELAAAAALLLTVVGVGLWFLRPASHSVPRTVPLTSYPGRQREPAFSPDGKQVAFAWDGEQDGNFNIYVKLVDAGTPLQLTSNPADEDSPVWSPDGRYIAFCRELSGHSEIWMIPALGGGERKLGEVAGIADLVGFCGGLSWSRDAMYLAVVDRNSPQVPFSISLLSIEAGDKRGLTSPPNGYIGDYAPRFSPDGESLAFDRGSYSDDIYVMRVGAGGVARGEPRRVIVGQGALIYGFDWTADGRKIVFSSGSQRGSTSLWMIPSSGGTPERLAVASNNAVVPSVSRSGSRLVYERDVFDSNIWRIPAVNSSDRASVPSRFIASTQPDLEPQFSPDGQKIVFSSNRSGNYELWTCDREGRNPVQLTYVGGPALGSPRWSPDSRWIAFDCSKAGSSDIYVINSDGGQPRRMTNGPSNHVRPSWSKDGRWIYFGYNPTGDAQIWKVPAEGGTPIQVTKKGGYEAFESADGKFVYYARLGAPGIWKIPIDGGEEIRVLERGRISLWAVTGQGIYFFDLDNPAAPALKFYNFAARKATVLREFSKETRVDTSSTALSVSPDGRWILYTQLDQSGSDLMLVENFR